MFDTQCCLQPRAKGSLALSAKRRGDFSVIDDLHQAGCMRLLFPHSGQTLDAVMINTSGGVTGGDNLSVSVSVGADAALTMTTQAAERAYRAQPGQTGRIATTLSVAAGGLLQWLPQEILLFDGCNLDRQLSACLAADARLLLVEPVIFGRAAMGETLTDITVRDRIAITRDGQPLYLDGYNIAGNAAAELAHVAIAQGMSAMASFVYVAPDAPAHLGTLRSALPETGGASLLAEDVLIGRLLAADGYTLRHSLIPMIEQLSGTAVPKTWRL